MTSTLLLLLAGAMFVVSCRSDDEDVTIVNAVGMDYTMNFVF